MSTAADKRLHSPDGGQPIERHGMPVTAEPVPGGVAVVNASVPAGHDAHVVYREQTVEEKRQQKKDTADNAAFQRVDATIFLRLTRDALLRATDHSDLPNGEKIAGGKAKHAAWLKWRQQLRDLPAKTKDPEEPKWPEPPAATSALLGHRGLWPDIDWGKLL